ncbi:reverse transcriptase domain-containing protein [Tanacetum coccineum]
MLPTNNGSTEDVQPPIVPVVHHESISEPVNAPVSGKVPFLQIRSRDFEPDPVAFTLTMIISFSTTSPTLTPFGDSDFLLFEEADSFLAIEDDPTSSEWLPFLLLLTGILPSKLMCDACDFAIGAVLGQRKNKHFQPIHYANKTMTEAQAHYTTTEKELLAVVYAFEKFRSYLVLSKSIVIRCYHRYKKGAGELAADHLSYLMNLYQDKLENKEITGNISTKLSIGCSSCDSTPWFTEKEENSMEMPKIPSKYVIIFGRLGLRTSWDVPIIKMESITYLWLSITVKWLKRGAPTKTTAEVVCKFLKSLFARFGAPRAIISDRGTHFCKDQFARVMLKYGVISCSPPVEVPAGCPGFLKPLVLAVFVLRSQELHNPQLHFENPISPILSDITCRCSSHNPVLIFDLIIAAAVVLTNHERISKKKTKNEAKTAKPDTEWKNVVKTKSRQSPSVKKSTKVNPDKSKVKPEAISEEK